MTPRTPRERPADSPWYTLEEAAQYARRSVRTVNDALRSGELRGHQSGGRGSRWTVNREDLDAWVRGEIAAVVAPLITRPKRSA